MKTIGTLAATAIVLTTAAVASPPSLNWIHAKTQAAAYTPPLAHKKKMPVIVENFATLYPKGLYNATVGLPFSGPASEFGEDFLAAAFTPAANATVQEVDVAAGHVGGSDTSFVVHLYTDASGVPGTELWSHQASLPLFGLCCAITALADKAGVALTAGTQYWIVLTTPDGADTVGGWNSEVLDQVHPGIFAQNKGAGWQVSTTAPQFAFGVYGR